MPAIFAFDDFFRQFKCILVELSLAENRQQQIKDLALIAGRRLDYEGRVGAAGVSIPLATKRLHAFLKTTLAAVVDTAEQQVFQQVRQFPAVAWEIVEADAHDQADRHMVAFITRLEYDLQTIGQQVTFYLGAIKGEAGRATQQ